MKKIVNAILVAIMVAALVFGFASCGNNAGGNGNTNPDEKPDNGGKPDDNDMPDEKPDDKFEVSGTSPDGKYSYEISENNLTLKYTGTDSPDIELAFFRQNASYSWGWSWFCSYRTKYSYEISMNIFEQCWASLWIASGKRPETQDLYVVIYEVQGSNKINVLGNDKFLSARFFTDEAFLDSKDYSQKTFTPVKKTFAEESANDAVAKMKMGANLSNHFESWSISDCNGKDLPPVIWETSWEERETTKAHIKYLKSLGFTAIRLPVTWWCHLDSNDNILPGWLNRIQEVINWCMEEDLYVILNTHHDSGGDGSGQWFFANADSYNKYSGRYRKIWEQLSEYFKEYDERLVFANANEVTENAEMAVYEVEKLTDAGYEYMGKWNQLFVDTVRASGGNNAKRNLVFSAPTTMHSVDYTKVQVPNDSAKNHLIFEYHCYDPGTFCTGDYWDGKVTTFDKSTFEEEKFLGFVWEFAQKNNVPVIAGEWGALDAYDSNGEKPPIMSSDDEKTKYANVFVPAAMKRGFGTFLWMPQRVFGFESIDDAINPCPKYLQAIKDCVANTPFDTVADYTPDFKSASLTMQTSQKAFIWDSTSGTQSTEYSGYYAEWDITSMFGGNLPQKDETIRLYFTVSTSKNTSEPVTYSVYLVDRSAAANNWCEILGTPDDRINIRVDNGNGIDSFRLDKIIRVKNAPSEKVLLRIEYDKTDYDDTMTMNVFSMFSPQ